jgi:uncharacterized protein YbjT (DUF2867 family)
MSAQRGGRSASRWILLTGASGGIGRATATRLADAGQVVFAAARRANALEELAATHPGIHPVSLDVSDQAAIDRARQQIMAETAGHGLDVLVNAAGILVLGPVEAASDALRLELAPFGVRVVLVQPGVVDTPLYARAAAAVNGDEEALQRYRAVWPGGLGFPERLLQAAASVDGIAATLASAALAPNPRPRYRPGVRNRLNTRLLTTLPTRSADRVKTWIAGGASSARRPPRPRRRHPHPAAAAAIRRVPTPRGRPVNRLGGQGMNDDVMEKAGEPMPMSDATDGRILVTGATGLAGSAVLREFVRNRHPVRALVRSRAKARAFEAFPTVEVVEGDMSRPATLEDALWGVDRVLLISSPDQQMVERQSAFIDAAKKADVRHIVKFSGLSAADVDTPFVFGSMHAEIERYLEGSGLAWTHLRPSQFMTEYLREVPTILAQSALLLPLEDARLVPVDVADIARAAYLLLTTPGHEGRIYAMSGPEALSMAEIAGQISAAVGRAVRYVPITRDQRKQALLAAGVPSYSVDALDAQAGERLKGTEATVHPETHTALGITPTLFAEFAGRNAGAFLGESAYAGLD